MPDLFPITVLVAVRRSKRDDIDDSIGVVTGTDIQDDPADLETVDDLDPVDDIPVDLVDDLPETKAERQAARVALAAEKARRQQVRADKAAAREAKRVAKLGRRAAKLAKVSEREARVFAKSSGHGAAFKQATIKSVVYLMDTVRVDSEDEIPELIKTNGFIAGAWYFNGQQVPSYPPHADLTKFMPQRVVVTGTGDDAVITMVDDPTPRTLVKFIGEGERVYA